MGSSDWVYSSYNAQPGFVESVETSIVGEGSQALKWACDTAAYERTWYLRRYNGPDASLFPTKALAGQYAIRLKGDFGQDGRHGIFLTPNLLPAGALPDMSLLNGVMIYLSYDRSYRDRCCIDWFDDGVQNSSSYYEMIVDPLAVNDFCQIQFSIVANPFIFEKYGSLRILYRYAANITAGDPLTEPNPSHADWGPWRSYLTNQKNSREVFCENFQPTWDINTWNYVWDTIQAMCNNGFYAYIATNIFSSFTGASDSNIIWDRVAFDVCTDSW